MASVDRWPAGFEDAMRAETQLGRVVFSGASSADSRILAADVPFLLQQTWFQENDPATSNKCSTLPPHVGLWGLGTTTTSQLTSTGTLVPGQPGTPYATLRLFGGPSLQPAQFVFELVNGDSDDPTAAKNTLLLRTTDIGAAFAPYVLLSPTKPWTYVTKSAALAVHAAWGVFRQRATSDAAPNVFLLFTSDEVRALLVPAALVIPMGVSVANGLATITSVFGIDAQTCSAGAAAHSGYLGMSGATIQFNAATGELDVTLDNDAGFGQDGAALTWQLLRPAPTRTPAEQRAARAKDVAVTAILGVVFLAFAIVLMWAVARKSVPVIAVSTVVCALCVVGVVTWFEWLRRYATPATQY